jgi:hypothetical protein
MKDQDVALKLHETADEDEIKAKQEAFEKSVDNTVNIPMLD